jgi:hypothetical protein
MVIVLNLFAQVTKTSIVCAMLAWGQILSLSMISMSLPIVTLPTSVPMVVTATLV